ISSLSLHDALPISVVLRVGLHRHADTFPCPRRTRRGSFAPVVQTWYNCGMASKDTAIRPLHIQVPVELHERLRRMAKARDRSVAAETRRAIEARLAEFEGAEKAA